jgi:alpha-tubulin suppressor-like RCC1 family protein
MLISFDEPSASGLHDLSCGLEHCAVLDSTGSSRTWGGPYYAIGAQEGVVFTDLDAGNYNNCGVTDAGSLHCWGLDTHGQVTPPDSGSYAAVSCGGTHCCALDTEGSAVCWGSDLSGQSTPPEGRFIEISAGDQHTCGRDVDGRVVCWGNDAQGQCEVPVDSAGG